MFKNKLMIVIAALLVAVTLVLATSNVSAGTGSGGHLGGIILQWL